MPEADHTFWFLTRASGLVAYLLLFASVVLGLTMTGGLLTRLLPRFRVYDMHRFLSWLGMALILFHALIVLPDGYIGFSLPQLFLPFASPYEPLFMALGVFALYLTAAIVGSFYALRRLGYRTWRLLHYATFAAFTLAFAHGVGAGSDSDTAWATYVYVATGLVAFNLLVYRALRGSARGGPEAVASARPAAGVAGDGVKAQPPPAN